MRGEGCLRWMTRAHIKGSHGVALNTITATRYVLLLTHTFQPLGRGVAALAGGATG